MMKSNNPDMPSKVSPMSSLEQLASLAAVIFINSLILVGLGCRSSQPSAPAQAIVPPSSGELDPVQTWNKYLGVLAGDDKEAMRECIYLRPSASEQDQSRLEGSIGVLSSSAALRKAFDQAYGGGSLAAQGFRCFTPETRVSQQSTFKVEGTNATAFAPNSDPIHLVRDKNAWKENFPAWAEIVRARSESGTPTLPIDLLLLNLQTVSQILDRTAGEVRSNAYRSAADALGVLNQRLHGQARELAPLAIAYSIDLTSLVPGTGTVSAPVSIIELRGDPVALGKSQGDQLGKVIHSVMDGYFKQAFDLSNKQGRKDYERAIKFATGFERYLRPEHLEEIHALAVTTRVDMGKVMLGQCFPETYAVGACSTVALPAAAAPDGIARFGRNMDYSTFGVLDQHTYLLVYHPRDRYAFASVAAAPGLIGVISGMNEHGLCLATMEVPRPLRLPHAMPSMLLFRSVMENCRTVGEAIAFLKKTRRQTAFNLMLMDASGDRAVAEITPSGVTIRRAPGDAALISTNHQRQNDLDTPGRCVRYDFLHDASRRQFGRISESTIEEMLAGAAQGDATYQSMIFDPANRVLTLAAGTDAPTHGFTNIDLKLYFR
jgi:isopenicillin-N N-acyltransferase-like protein